MHAVEGGNRRVSLLSSFAKELRTKAQNPKTPKPRMEIDLSLDVHVPFNLVLQLSLIDRETKSLCLFLGSLFCSRLITCPDGSALLVPTFFDAILSFIEFACIVFRIVASF